MVHAGLLRVQPSEALVAAAARRGLPLHVLHCDAPDLVKVYGRQLLLVRPDQHVAWRGSACDSPGVCQRHYRPRAGLGTTNITTLRQGPDRAAENASATNSR